MYDSGSHLRGVRWHAWTRIPPRTEQVPPIEMFPQKVALRELRASVAVAAAPRLDAGVSARVPEHGHR